MRRKKLKKKVVSINVFRQIQQDKLVYQVFFKHFNILFEKTFF